MNKIYVIILMCFSFVAKAQEYKGPKVDSLKLLMDINGGNVQWVTSSSANVVWGNGYGVDNMAFIAALRDAITLPVTLHSFSAKKVGDLVNVKWSTSSEENFSHFEVLKSIDGKYFQSIAYVKANGKSVKKIDYQFGDKNPVNGVNYYKLKMVDLDGVFKESIIVSVTYDLNKPDVIVVADASQGIVNFNVFVNQAGVYKVDLIDLQGKKVATKSLKLEKGNNSFTFNLKLAPQVLIAVLDSGAERIARKFYY